LPASTITSAWRPLTRHVVLPAASTCLAWNEPSAAALVRSIERFGLLWVPVAVSVRLAGALVTVPVPDVRSTESVPVWAGT